MDYSRVKIIFGYDYSLLINTGISIPIYGSPLHHILACGGTGSGKSTFLLLFILRILRSGIPARFWIFDFKKSREFYGISDHFYEFLDCYGGLVSFYEDVFNCMQEGGDGNVYYILFDEIAGFLVHLELNGKEGKAKANRIRDILSSMLMLGRSRNIFVVLSLQRFTASIFRTSSGSGDNVTIRLCLGRNAFFGENKKLFEGEPLADVESMTFGMGKGVLILDDGNPPRGVILPKADKRKMLSIIHSLLPQSPKNVQPVS